jgi:hypothetical protein
MDLNAIFRMTGEVAEVDMALWLLINCRKQNLTNGGRNVYSFSFYLVF